MQISNSWALVGLTSFPAANQLTAETYIFVFCCTIISSRETIIIISGASSFELDTHIAAVSLAKDNFRASLNEYFSNKFDSLISQLDPLQQRAVLRAKEFNLSGWLSVLPLA